MKKGQRQLLAAGVIIVLLVVAVEWMGFIDYIPGIPPVRVEQPAAWTPTQMDDYKKGIGMFEASHTCYDSLAPSTALTHATDYDIYWYSKRGAQWVYHGTGGTAASPVLVALTPEDEGFLYVVVAIHSGAAYYADAAKIQAVNSYVVQTLYQDIDGDTVKEFVFKYNMQGHSIPSSGYPAISFKAHCLAYDSSFTGLNNLSNSTGIGNATTTKWHLWYLAFSAERKAVALSKIEFKVTTTDETKVKLKQLEVPGRGFLDVSNFVFDTTATYYTWTYTYGTTFDTAYYLQRPAGTKNQFDMDVRVEYTLADGTDILITLTVYYLVAQTEARTSTSDSLYACD